MKWSQSISLAEMVMEIAGKKLKKKHIKGPLGVRGRNSDNRLIEKKLGWRPTKPLKRDLKKPMTGLKNK